MTAYAVDLNCDCGEGFGPYRLGDDRSMLDIVTTANVACGFHAGDPEIMGRTFTLAKKKGVAVGAHPGFEDRAGFGRRAMSLTGAEIERLVAYQIGAAAALATQVGHRLTHVKPHGALSNIAMKETDVARAIVKAAKAVDASLAFLAVAGTELERESKAVGLRTIPEVFADRGYTDEGYLVPRSEVGAIIEDCEKAADRAVTMVSQGAIISRSGKRIEVGIGSICVHGDTPGAVEMARTVRVALETAGIVVRAFAGA